MTERLTKHDTDISLGAIAVSAWRAILWTVAALLPIGVVTAVLTDDEEPSRPHCPQEDSCTVDYRDGGWHMREITRP